MFEVVVPSQELFNEATSEFIQLAGGKFQIEHSLLSISKWESKWHKPFWGSGRFEKHELVGEEYIDYLRMMTLTKNVPDDLYYRLSRKNHRDIDEYMKNPMTATTIKRGEKSTSWSIVTSEIIYWEMIQLGIPFECQKWHINRLMTLIEVCVQKGSKPEKVPYAEMVADRRALNQKRLSQMKSRG